jgi:hypothetical protein
MSPLPCLWFLGKSLLLSHLPISDLFMVGSIVMGERETTLKSADHRITGQRESGKMMQTWIT